MKCLVICALFLAVTAEPPRFRGRFRSQRQELAPTTTDSPMESTTGTGPYPPSGWKPAGAAFTLPIDTTPAPAPTDTYGPPEGIGQYPPSGWKPAGAGFTLPTDTTVAPTPADTYGPPEASGPYPPSGWKPDRQFALPQEQAQPTAYGVPDKNLAPTDAPTTENPQAETLVEPVQVQNSLGTYYIVLPNGQLQRAQYMEMYLQGLKNYLGTLQLSSVPVFGP